MSESLEDRENFRDLIRSNHSDLLVRMLVTRQVPY